MILPTILYTLKGKLWLGMATLGTVLLAAGEANSNSTLIICSVITMLGTLFTGIVALINANRVTTLSKGIDGVAHELKAATAEGNLAKVDAALAKGQLKERNEETARKGAEALAQQALLTPTTSALPIPVISKNPPEDAVN